MYVIARVAAKCLKLLHQLQWDDGKLWVVAGG